MNQFEGLFWRRSQILRHPQVKVDVGAFCFELTSASVLYKESQKYMDKNDKNTTLNLSTSSADYFVTTVLRMTCEEPEPQNISRSTKSRNSDRLKAARQHLGISTLPSSIIGEMRKHQRIQRKAPSTSLKGSFIGSIVTFTSLHCPPKQLKFSNHWSTSVAAWVEPLHSISSSFKTTWSNVSIHTNWPLWTSMKDKIKISGKNIDAKTYQFCWVFSRPGPRDGQRSFYRTQYEATHCGIKLAHHLLEVRHCLKLLKKMPVP